MEQVELRHQAEGSGGILSKTFYILVIFRFLFFFHFYFIYFLSRTQVALVRTSKKKKERKEILPVSLEDGILSPLYTAPSNIKKKTLRLTAGNALLHLLHFWKKKKQSGRQGSEGGRNG